MHVLIAVSEGLDYQVFGPFATVPEAQEFARAFREHHDIPGSDNVEPTAEENEAWTDADWYFGIYTLDAPELVDPSEPGAPGNDDDRYQED